MLKLSKYPPKGFTLIELLVVVLIIGILAAIALPQYRLSVDKTKFAGYQTMAKSIADAYWRYILVNNAAPTDIDELDVDLPAGYTKTTPLSSSCAVFANDYCCIGSPRYDYQRGHVVCGRNDYSFAFGQNLISADGSSNDIFKSCYAKNDNPRAIRLCSNLPYISKYSANMPSPGGHRENYSLYVF